MLNRKGTDICLSAFVGSPAKIILNLNLPFDDEDSLDCSVWDIRVRVSQHLLRISMVIDWCHVNISAQLPLKGTPAFKDLHFQVFHSHYKLFYLTIFNILSYSVILYFVPSIYPSTTVRVCSHLWKKCPLCCHHFVKWRCKCQVSCSSALRTMNESRWCNSSVCFIHKEKGLPPAVQKFVKSLWCPICDIQS